MKNSELMNSLIKAMFSLDRRSKSMDDHKRTTSVSTNDNMMILPKIQKKVLLEKGAAIKRLAHDQATKRDPTRSPKYLEIPSIQLTTTTSTTKAELMSRSFEFGTASCSDVLSPSSPSKMSDRTSRVTFFRLSKIGKRIRKKFLSGSRSFDDNDAVVDDAKDDGNVCGGEDDDNKIYQEIACVSSKLPKWKSISLKKVENKFIVKSANRSLESRLHINDLRRTHSSSPISIKRMHVRTIHLHKKS